jgi:hypothetical protein
MHNKNSKWIWIVLAATTACAGAQPRPDDRLTGHWAGVIDRDGWERNLFLNIKDKNGILAGSWMSLEAQPGLMLESIAIEGEKVRFRVSNLAFDGRINGGELTGQVTDSASGQSSGNFRLMRIEPHSIAIP